MNKLGNGSVIKVLSCKCEAVSLIHRVITCTEYAPGSSAVCTWKSAV